MHRVEKVFWSFWSNFLQCNLQKSLSCRKIFSLFHTIKYFLYDEKDFFTRWEIFSSQWIFFYTTKIISSTQWKIFILYDGNIFYMKKNNLSKQWKIFFEDDEHSSTRWKYFFMRSKIFFYTMKIIFSIQWKIHFIQLNIFFSTKWFHFFST